MRPIDADALEKDYREDFERVYKHTRDAVNPADFYIERKAAYDKELVRMEMEAFCKYLQSRPTIDAVPVVRCKDCVHAAELEGYPKRRFENGLNCMACRGDNGYGIANLSLTTPDGYCDDGVLRWDSEDE